MKNVFKKAHEITKNIIRKGDSYRETFRLALIFVYSQLRNTTNTVEEKLVEKGYKIWKKSDSLKRIYINNMMECAERFNVKIENPKGYRKDSMYYDCVKDIFVYSCTSSRKETFNNIISAIRN